MLERFTHLSPGTSHTIMMHFQADVNLKVLVHLTHLQLHLQPLFYQGGEQTYVCDFSYIT